MLRSRTNVKSLCKTILIGACMLAALPCMSQEKKVTQTAGVNNTRMGAYPALAQLAYQAFQKGDNSAAAELARILERTWDQGEWKNSSDSSYCKENRSTCQPIDHGSTCSLGQS
jgi:hypothetical protein